MYMYIYICVCVCVCEYKYIQIHMYVSTGGAKVPAASKYDFHLHAKTYIVSSGSSDSSFDTVVGGLFRISIFSIGPKLF